MLIQTQPDPENKVWDSKNTCNEEYRTLNIIGL
jgi:hypothetical protein